MILNVPTVRERLKNFELEKLFVEELGWDRHTSTLDVAVDDQTWTLRAFAEKRGVQIFECQPDSAGEIPDYRARRKIEKEVTKSAYEHLIVFVDGDKTTQIWQWVARQPGQPAAYREHPYHPQSQSGEALIQKLSAITIPLDEEEALDLAGTVHKLRDAFDRDRVTKRFYDHFKREHAAFLKFIKGITDQGDSEWYASLMLNRLMFVYFIQKKGFLDGDLNYLQNRLQNVQQRKGKGKFLTFYRYFLLALFHEGFSKQPQQRQLDPELTELLGKVPYLNGGLFELHELEQKYPKANIPDEAFEKLFAFFDQYEWHLDTRPLADDREINPEVLGYIFEKYINQKQMGAYYTKEDITDYISKNTIIPYLFDAAKKKCAVAFQSGSALWRLLQDDPDRYIYAAVRKGVIDEDGKVIPLPEQITAGIDDIPKRGGWNRAADPQFALPTETWREHVARRQRCLELRQKLASGHIHEINDLVTLNLDIRQFAQDVVENCEGPELLRSFYHAIAGRMSRNSREKFTPSISVLDPTCGSGAFLFAALNILEPLYEACLERMEAFIQDSELDTPPTPEEQIEAIIAQGESTAVEFKSSARWDVREKRANKELGKVIVKTVAAMLNTEGGDLLIGVDDDGKAFGVEHDYKLMGKNGNRDGYENWLTTLLLGQYGKHCSQHIRISFASMDGNDVCRVSVDPSPTAVYIKDGENEHLYIRAGNSSRLLTARETVNYHKQRFDGQTPKRKGPPVATTKRTKAKHEDFRRILDDVDRHPNRAYFILKSIVVGNLYGVDIMEEAVEICKLRLFLKLVAQIDRVKDLEPLPDIDFNIRAGNTLVGFATLDAVKKSLAGTLGFDKDQVDEIVEEAEIVDRAFRRFHEMQTEHGMDATEFSTQKQELRERLNALGNQLDRYLAGDYGIDADKPRKLAQWQESHRPFHWLAEFYGIMSCGGFDVIVGNPPYVGSGKVDYLSSDMVAAKFPDIYALIVLRSVILSKSVGRCGMIVPLSLTFSKDFGQLRESLGTSGGAWFSSYDNIPAAVFAGVSQRCTIWIGDKTSAGCFTTQMYRWRSVFRSVLMQCLNYTETIPDDVASGGLPKLPSSTTASVLAAVHTPPNLPQRDIMLAGRDKGRPRLGFSQAARNFVSVFKDDPPCLDVDSLERVPPSKIGYITCRSTDDVNVALVSLSGELYLSYWLIRGDGFDVTTWIIKEFLHCVNYLPKLHYALLARMGELLDGRRFEALVFKKNAGKYVGNFNYRWLSPITRRADLLTLAGLGLARDESLAVFDHVQRVLAINEHAGEKSIPYQIKNKFPPKRVSKDQQQKLFHGVDRVLAKHYGFTNEELDFIINRDIKFGTEIDNGDDE